MNGRVFLVGAGPGDPGLLTARALELIARADTILYDRLIPAEALEGARADAELLFVGKQGGGKSVPQEQTEALMVERARAGKVVVRLKGGDPFVFGRGGEEALTLRAAGIPFEVVPGITAGVAATAYAGIPVTHRGLASAVALITGHTRTDGARTEAGDAGQGEAGDAGQGEAGDAGQGEAGDAGQGEAGDAGQGEAGDAGQGEASDAGRGAGDGEAEEAEGKQEGPKGEGEVTALDWPALAAFPGTLVFYMGVRQLPHIAASLIAAGRPPSEPAAIVERGTLPHQRTVTGTLATIAERARAQEIRAPSITVVGAVAGLATELAWRAPQPLSGRTVAVTRARAQTSGLARRLRELGAEVVQAPVIRIQPLADGGTGLQSPPLDLSQYDLVCLTSPNGVAQLFKRLAQSGRHPADARALAGARVAAIGPGTALALAEHGIAADIVPERYVAESLVEALAELPVRHALIARAREARDVLPDALRARGAEVDVLELYETVAEPLSPPALAAARAADYITFTSSSTVRFFLEAAGGSADLSPSTRIVSIGPVTSATLREHDLEPDVEAADHDIDGLVAALLADATSRDE